MSLTRTVRVVAGEAEAVGVPLITPVLAFNVNPAESDLRPMAASDVQKVAQRYEAPVVENFEAYQRVDRSRRHGTELWQPFLLALLALLFIEVLLQQRIARP